MTKARKAFLGCDIFDGHTRHQNAALLVGEAKVLAILPAEDLPTGINLVRFAPNSLITPGFVDLQVNGGGGVMLNDAPNIDTIRTICDAHLAFGTTSLLATLITDTLEITNQAIQAAKSAITAGVDGLIGLHLEGPHLSPHRKGAHDLKLIRKMEADDLDLLVTAAKSLPSLLTTVALESATFDQIEILTQAKAIVSIGHSDAEFADTILAVEHGARCVTHLFNAMSPLENRQPGLVGAALECGALFAGLIADGIHVDAATIKIALRAKTGPGKIFLVTDSMSTIGTDQTEFYLNGRLIKRENRRLTLMDGTLAGADLDMISAVRFMVNTIGLSVEEAVRMASLYPAQVLKRDDEIGQLCAGSRSDFLQLSDALEIESVWQAGALVFDAAINPKT